MEGRRSVILKWLLVVGTTLVGIAGMVMFRQVPALKSWGWTETFLSLSEALTIAGILGLTVEGALRAGLVRRLSAEATAVLWGVNAPQEYITGLRDSLGDIKLVALSGEWEIELDWIDHSSASGLLRVQCTLRVRVQNIATEPASFADPWLAHSADRAAARDLTSNFMSYTCSAAEQPIGRRDSNERSERWSPTELQDPRVSEICDDGSVRLKRDRLPRIDKVRDIQPGGTGRIEIVGVTFQPPTGGFPLVNRIPNVATSLKISGPPLADEQLQIEVYLPGKSNAPIRDRGQLDKLEWKFGFLMPGTTIRVEWQPVSRFIKSAMSSEQECSEGNPMIEQS